MSSENKSNSHGTLDWDVLMESTEAALTTQFSMSRVNEPLLLYRGAITIEFGNGLKISDAAVTWEWRREPVILCSYDPAESQRMTGNAADVLCQAHKLVLDDLGVSTWAVFHEGHSCGPMHHQKLELVRQVSVGQLGPVHKAIFHLVNCHDRSEQAIRSASGGYVGSGRLRLENGEWVILIDKVPKHDDLVRELNMFGGQAITHVAQVSRRDGTAFEIEMLNEVLGFARDFLAFATGSKPQVCLVSGFNGQGVRIWEVWGSCGPSHWSPLANWTSHHISGHVSRAFRGYFSRLLDPYWKEPISLASDWYVQAKHRGLETALVLGQAALELLAVSVLEQSTFKPCSEKEWESKQWPASRRIRWMLETLGINASLPPLLTKLHAFKFPNGKPFDDGPHALTELRNAIAHPKKQKRERFGLQVGDLRHEAAMMTLFFLENALLVITEFDGLAEAGATHGCLINYGLPIS